MRFLILIILLVISNAEKSKNGKKKIKTNDETNSTAPLPSFDVPRHTNDFVIERSTAKRLKKLIHAKTLQARRYAQFEAMFRQTFQNHTLLLRFYAYGCYCLNLGDRPLAGIMTGMEPADLLDASCFEWTKCNRCVVFDYGPMCSPEITAYSWDFDDNGVIRCLDDDILPPEDGPKKWYEGYGPGSVPGCKRALCECDKEQLYALLNGNLLTEVWNVRFHQFFGGFLFTDCVPKPKSKSEPDINCCGEYPARNPFDRNNAICCDGEINDEGRCVGSSFNKKRKRRALSPEEKEKKKKQKSAFWPKITMSQRFLRDQKKMQLQLEKREHLSRHYNIHPKLATIEDDEPCHNSSNCYADIDYHL